MHHSPSYLTLIAVIHEYKLNWGNDYHPRRNRDYLPLQNRYEIFVEQIRQQGYYIRLATGVVVRLLPFPWYVHSIEDLVGKQHLLVYNRERRHRTTGVLHTGVAEVDMNVKGVPTNVRGFAPHRRQELFLLLNEIRGVVCQCL